MPGIITVIRCNLPHLCGPQSVYCPFGLFYFPTMVTMPSIFPVKTSCVRPMLSQDKEVKMVVFMTSQIICKDRYREQETESDC